MPFSAARRARYAEAPCSRTCLSFGLAEQKARRTSRNPQASYRQRNRERWRAARPKCLGLRQCPLKHPNRYRNGALGLLDTTRTTTTTTRYRRTPNAERRDARVTSNNVRAHDAARRHDRDRDHDSDHDRDRCGPPRRSAPCASCDTAPSLAMAVEVPAVTRRVKRAARHARRASRARMCTSPPHIARIVSPPPRAQPARARYSGTRSLDRSRAVCGVGDGGGGGGRLHRASCATRNRASLARTSTPSTRIARVIADFRSPGHARVAVAAGRRPPATGDDRAPN